jgi:hypothetical protein
MNVKLVWILWGLSLTLMIKSTATGSLWILNDGTIWLLASWRLLKHYFNDDDDDYTDCLGI